MKSLKFIVLLGLGLSSIQPRVKAADTEFFEKSGLGTVIKLGIAGLVLSPLFSGQSKPVAKTQDELFKDCLNTAEKVVRNAEETLQKYRDETELFVEAFLAAEDERAREQSLSLLQVNQNERAFFKDLDRILGFRASRIRGKRRLVENSISELKSKSEFESESTIQSLEAILKQLNSALKMLDKVCFEVRRNDRYNKILRDLQRKNNIATE